MDNLKLAGNLINVILRVEHANESELKLARGTLIGILNKVGAKNFVNVAADILKNNFHIEGCNDVRMPLKRIFTISLGELEEVLLKKEYSLPEGHPIYILSEDHKDNIEKLKVLKFSLGEIKNDISPEQIKDKLRGISDYYTELDLHIRKEEEVLFPKLEENGMQEHPQNLREDHKKFRDALSEIIKFLKDFTPGKLDLAIEEIKKSKEKFISDISNHIFRETFIFYPAALEFITKETIWDEIRQEFNAIA